MKRPEDSGNHTGLKRPEDSGNRTGLKNRKMKKQVCFVSREQESSLLTFETYLFLSGISVDDRISAEHMPVPVTKLNTVLFTFFAIASGHREDCTSPICALRRKNIQIRDCPIPPPIV